LEKFGHRDPPSGSDVVPILDELSLTETIQLQNRISATLKQRFERVLTVAFCDVVESTAYFAKFGDVEGRRLVQRLLDSLQQALSDSEGRIVDTAGDGALLIFPRPETALEGFARLEEIIARGNAQVVRDHYLSVRIGIHWGVVLTDGVVLAGDAVNLCARVAASATPGEIRLTRAAFLELPTLERLRCEALPALALKGISEPVDVLTFQWRDTRRFPRTVIVVETGEQISLPDQDRVTFGRLRELNGVQANDIVLALPDPNLTQRISRWHFELRCAPDGMRLRQLSARLTDVDGRILEKDSEVAIGHGTVVRVSDVATLHFLADSDDPGRDHDSGNTLIGTAFGVLRPR